MLVKATPRKFKAIYIVLSRALFTLALFALLGACISKETELPLETIERSNYSSGYKERNPNLIIIADEKEINQLDGLVTPEVLDRIRRINYDDYFVVAAFLGWYHKVHEGIRIEQITRQNNLVSIYAQVGELTGKDAESSPYHLVRVQKVGQWNATIDFALVVKETTVASQSHYIP